MNNKDSKNKIKKWPIVLIILLLLIIAGIVSIKIFDKPDSSEKQTNKTKENNKETETTNTFDDNLKLALRAISINATINDPQLGRPIFDLENLCMNSNVDIKDNLSRSVDINAFSKVTCTFSNNEYIFNFIGAKEFKNKSGIIKCVKVDSNVGCKSE